MWPTFVFLVHVAHGIDSFTSYSFLFSPLILAVEGGFLAPSFSSVAFSMLVGVSWIGGWRKNIVRVYDGVYET